MELWEYGANLVELLRVVTYGVGVGGNEAADGTTRKELSMSTTRKQLLEAVSAHKAGRSAWSRGVKAYAVELVESLEDDADLCNEVMLQKALLNGADDWRQYSEGGAALIYDADIAERLCSPSELNRCKGGERQPNASETWLDVQARALWQAHRLIVWHWEQMGGGAA